ncbi:tetratricopeptide repeat protein [Occallatibacter savannae]|uniref:tetratricopeptide repeat protein n=1 Tax=Occallatibacter savannae TaxID=1002691 RepID=UPI0013A5702E|nr:tetratricopeptide repeat protein [Occallatibacter savannae]
MVDETAPLPQPSALLASQVYAMALICLLAGLGIGYLMRSSQFAVASPQRAAVASPHSSTPAGHPHSLEELKQISDRQAAPLLDKLKSSPRDTALLTQVAALYHTTHRFSEAAGYYKQAVDIDPRNVPFRTKLAASLYRGGDVDGAIAQLNQALTYEPRDPNALFNLGMIKLQAKGDSKGAVAAWRQLLKSNPDLSPDRKSAVMKAMADALNAEQHGIANPGAPHASN